jgi:hydroxymethylbilane synthase
LGIEIRADRPDVAQALGFLLHQPTWLTVSAERAVSRMMGGSCSMPLAAHATLTGGSLHIDAAWGDQHGVQPLVRAQASALATDTASAVALGEQVAAQLQRGIAAEPGQGH